MSDPVDKKLTYLVQRLKGQFGREPTEEEVLSFIEGSDEERIAIWNKEKK